jgi:hypothetical protein
MEPLWSPVVATRAGPARSRRARRRPDDRGARRAAQAPSARARARAGARDPEAGRNFLRAGDRSAVTLDRLIDERLIADTELAGDLTQRAAADLDQADGLTPELRRIRPLIPLWHNAPASSPSATLTKRSDVRRTGGSSRLWARASPLVNLDHCARSPRAGRGPASRADAAFVSRRCVHRSTRSGEHASDEVRRRWVVLHPAVESELCRVRYRAVGAEVALGDVLPAE